MLVLIKINISSKTRGDFSQQGWNVYYRGGVIALHFSHNPPRTIKTPMVSFAAGRDKTMATPARYASGVRMGVELATAKHGWAEFVSHKQILEIFTLL